jgi:hypothetical protein
VLQADDTATRRSGWVRHRSPGVIRKGCRARSGLCDRGRHASSPREPLRITQGLGGGAGGGGCSAIERGAKKSRVPGGNARCAGSNPGPSIPHQR